MMSQIEKMSRETLVALLKAIVMEFPIIEFQLKQILEEYNGKTDSSKGPKAV